MRLVRVAATATALSLVGAATLVSPAKAANPGVGTTAESSSLLNIALGTNGSLLNLKVLADDARSTIDPTVAVPEAFTKLNALSLTSSILPAPLNNISLPVVESRSPGGQGQVAGPGFNFANPLPGLNIPAAVLSGSITPASLTSSVDNGIAKSGLNSTIGGISLVGGLIKAAGLESTLGATAATSAADGSRTIKAGEINVLDLGALLNGLGIPLSALPLDAVSAIIESLGLPLPGLPTSLDLETFVGELNQTIAGLEAQINAAGQAVDATVNQVLGSLPINVLGTLNLPVPTIGTLVTTVTQTLAQVRGIVMGLVNEAIKLLDGVSLLKIGGIELGTVIKAADTVTASKADVVAKIGSISVGGLELPGLDLGSTLAQVNSVVNTVNGTLQGVLGSISPDLANIVKVGVFEKDANTGVKSDGGYTKALAGVSALTASITPPLNLDEIVSGLLGGNGIGSILTGLGGSLPVVDTLMATLNGLLGQAVSALSGGATIKLANVTSGASFTTPVAATNGTLPRTGGTAQMALLGMALVIAAVASRRFVLAHRA